MGKKKKFANKNGLSHGKRPRAMFFLALGGRNWSGRRVSNSRPQPWQGCALPTELLPHLGEGTDEVLTDAFEWSGRRVSNSRPQPWQGCALPTELLPHSLMRHLLEKSGGAKRNRTAVDGFAIRCITTLLSRHPSMRLRRQILERETSLELATSTLARLRSTN